MYDNEVVDKRDKEDIESVKSVTRRNERLLSVLSRKTAEQFKRFLDVLAETGQQHVRDRITGAALPGTELRSWRILGPAVSMLVCIFGCWGGDVSSRTTGNGKVC